jgi:hypothetical protein
MLTEDRPGIVEPEEPHWVEPIGSIKMQVEFFDHAPSMKPAVQISAASNYPSPRSATPTAS